MAEFKKDIINIEGEKDLVRDKNSKAIINGDSSQMDLYNKNDSGLTEAENKLNSVPGIGFVNLKNSDVGRHSLVKKILDAYSN